MSQCREDRDAALTKYLLIFAVSASLSCISPKVFAQADTTTRREHPQPPPRPKHPSLKEMVNKINIFKKHKDDAQPTPTPEPVKPPDPVPLPPPPKPTPQPEPVKPKTPVKHTTKKKTKKATGTKKPAAPKPTQPLI
jgi:hypothetical protein